MGVLLLLAVVGLLGYSGYKIHRSKTPSFIISHWSKLVENLQQSSQDFYQAVHSAIYKRNIPDVELRQLDIHEGGVLSAKRIYLRVNRKEHTFDICAAPFGNGFFISWWLGEITSGFWSFVMVIPLIGPLLVRILHPQTYYRFDTALMFQESVHAAILEVLDSTTQAKGLRSLTESERKPIMRDFFKR